VDSRTIDELGNRFFCLEVIAADESRGDGARWICRCDCGKRVSRRAASLRKGYNKDCGCRISGHKKLIDAIVDIGTPPCEKGCAYVDKCGEEELACEPFRGWAFWGGDHEPDPENFRPTQAIYRRLYR